jgi:hypothetical protein
MNAIRPAGGRSTPGSGHCANRVEGFFRAKARHCPVSFHTFCRRSGRLRERHPMANAAEFIVLALHLTAPELVARGL